MQYLDRTSHTLLQKMQCLLVDRYFSFSVSNYIFDNYYLHFFIHFFQRCFINYLQKKQNFWRAGTQKIADLFQLVTLLNLTQEKNNSNPLKDLFAFFKANNIWLLPASPLSPKIQTIFRSIVVVWHITTVVC